MLTHGQPAIIAMPQGTPEGARREEAARQVVLAFGPLPPSRLLCFFDEQDCWAFKDENIGFGKANRGLSGPVTSPADLEGWPFDVTERLFPAAAGNENESAYDFVTYLHNSSCENPVGMTMTFAHELRHFVQWATMPAVWKANERFKSRRLDRGVGFDSHELPIEKDARIVSKQIAIRIHGREAVSATSNRALRTRRMTWTEETGASLRPWMFRSPTTWKSKLCCLTTS